jgi:hypothetical protein
LVVTFKETFKDLGEAIDARIPVGTLPPPAPIVGRRRKRPFGWFIVATNGKQLSVSGAARTEALRAAN